jgi:hypothetical protein
VRPIGAWILVIVVIALVTMPIIDIVWCPDGCGTSMAPSFAAETSCGQHAGCGVCQNGLAIDSCVARFDVPLEVIATRRRPAFDVRSIGPLTFDPPPRSRF